MHAHKNTHLHGLLDVGHGVKHDVLGHLDLHLLDALRKAQRRHGFVEADGGGAQSSDHDHPPVCH